MHQCKAVGDSNLMMFKSGSIIEKKKKTYLE